MKTCPHGCGNTFNENQMATEYLRGSLSDPTLGYCPACRRCFTSPEVVIGEDEKTIDGVRDPMTARKPSWCWEWWGPPNHRMKCRLPKDHDGEHDTHEQRSDSMIIATDGKLIK